MPSSGIIQVVDESGQPHPVVSTVDRQLEVVDRSHELLQETNRLLRKLILGLEIVFQQEFPDVE